MILKSVDLVRGKYWCVYRCYVRSCLMLCFFACWELLHLETLTVRAPFSPVADQSIESEYDLRRMASYADERLSLLEARASIDVL